MRGFLRALTIFAVLAVSSIARPANATCVPSTATPGMIGCEPVVTTMLGTDYVPVWTPASFPTSANLITLDNLLIGRTGLGTVSYNAQTGTSYTLQSTDCGKYVSITNALSITLTTLATLPVGCTLKVLQGGAGQITVANGSGATLNSAHSFTKTFGIWAVVELSVDSNVGGSAGHFVLSGDGA